MKRRTKIVLYILGAIIVLTLLYIIFFYEFSDFTFNFYIEDTGEKLDGELIINNISYGLTSNGKITLPVENLSISSFGFKTHYGEEDFYFAYNFSEEYLEWGESDFVVSKEQLNPKKANLFFYDNKTSCKLNGDVYLGDKLVGTSKEGNFKLTKTIYDNFWNSDIAIKGLTDSCFGEMSNLPFVEYWTISNLDYYFENDEPIEFVAELTPRQPRYYEEMQGFVRPEETKDYLNGMLKNYFKNNTQEDLDIIANYMKISYVSDSNLFKKSEYWQTPAETLNKKMGDCEDWAVTTLSLMREYNDSIKCYNILWETHLSIFCYFDNRFIIYDQDRTKFQTSLETENIQDFTIQQENKVAIREMRNSYFDLYGLHPNERKMYALFNEKELVIFNEDEDFVDWAINLINN